MGIYNPDDDPPLLPKEAHTLGSSFSPQDCREGDNPKKRRRKKTPPRKNTIRIRLPKSDKKKYEIGDGGPLEYAEKTKLQKMFGSDGVGKNQEKKAHPAAASTQSKHTLPHVRSKLRRQGWKNARLVNTRKANIPILVPPPWLFRAISPPLPPPLPLPNHPPPRRRP